MKLYEITDELQAIEDELIESEGVVTEDISARLASLESKFESKAESIAMVCRNIEANEKAAREEAQRLAKLASSREKARESLKAYLKGEMELLGITRIETPRGNIRIQSNSMPSISYVGLEAGMPDEYKKTVITFNSKAAYEDWKAGLEMPPNVEVVKGTHIRLF